MRIGRLHILTDTSSQNRFGHAELAEQAIRGGAEAIQFRQKSGSTQEMIREAQRVRAVCRRSNIPLLINDRVDVAIAADADGVHLGRDDFPIRLARLLLGPHRIIGGSAGTIEEALAGLREGADYLGCGPVFTTKTKADAGAAAGPALIRELSRAVSIPVLGIGGIDASNAREVIEAGAYGVAVVAAVCTSPDPEEATRQIRRALDETIGQRGS